MSKKILRMVAVVLAAVALSVSASVCAQGCGELWSPVSLPEGTNGLYGGIWANNQFVAFGNGVTMASPDGLSWDVNAPGTFGWVTGVAYGAGRYVAAMSTDRAILVSEDGHHWNKHLVEGGGWFQDVTYAKGVFVAVALHGHIWTSPDGLNWTRHETGYGKWFTSVAYGNGRFVAVGVGGIIATSPDGMVWHRRTPRNVGRVIAYGLGPRIAFGPAGFVVVDGGNVHVSADGKSWTPYYLGEFYGLQSVTYTGSEYVAVGEVIVASPNGVNWTLRSTPIIHVLYGVVSSGNSVLALGANGNAAEVFMSTCGP